MVAKKPEPYIDPVSEGICEVVDCSSPAADSGEVDQGSEVKAISIPAIPIR